MRLDEFKLKHLRMLVALQEHQKVGTVAKMFGITQPALSRTFAELEERAGHRLFVRHNRGTSMTPEGEVLARHARTVLFGTARAEQDMALVASGQRGSVSIGTIMTPASDYVVPALSTMFAQHSDIDVSVVVGSSDVLLSQLDRGEIDFAICRFPASSNVTLYDYTPLGLESLRMVVSRDHPLAGRDMVASTDVSELDWVLQPSGSFLRQMVDDFHIRHVIRPRSVVSTSSVLLTLLLVKESTRVGIFAKTTAELFDNYGLIRALPITTEIAVPGFGLVKLRDRELTTSATKAYQSFLEFGDRQDLAEAVTSARRSETGSSSPDAKT